MIETKTFRKGGGIPGRDDGKVTFDGQNLDWPWGVDNEGLEQAERNALWLMETLKKESGQRVHVTPLLVVTCWFLVPKITKQRRLCRPVNHKWLPREIGESPSLLPPAAIETLSGCVETRCRDVSYF